MKYRFICVAYGTAYAYICVHRWFIISLVYLTQLQTAIDYHVIVGARSIERKTSAVEALSVEEGADTAVWLATLPADGSSGGFFNSRQPVPW